MTKRDLRQIVMRHPNEVLQPYGAMLEMNGFDAICAFSDYYGGREVYIPNLRSLFSRCIEEDIRNEVFGTDIVFLSKKFGYSTRHVRRLLSKR